MIQNVTLNDFEAEVRMATEPVMAYFTATWCGPCRIVSPMIDKLAEEYEGKVKIVKVDIEQADKISREYNIRGVPSFLLFVRGELVKRYVGASLTEAEFREILDTFVLASGTSV